MEDFETTEKLDPYKSYKEKACYLSFAKEAGTDMVTMKVNGLDRHIIFLLMTGIVEIKDQLYKEVPDELFLNAIIDSLKMTFKSLSEGEASDGNP